MWNGNGLPVVAAVFAARGTHPSEDHPNLGEGRFFWGVPHKKTQFPTGL